MNKTITLDEEAFQELVALATISYDSEIDWKQKAIEKGYDGGIIDFYDNRISIYRRILEACGAE